MQAGIIGVGKLGLPCAEVMAEYHEIEGYDPEPVRPSNFRMVSSLAEVCANKDLIFIAASTPHHQAYGGEAPSTNLPPKDFDYSTVKSILNALNKLMKQLVLQKLLITPN